MADSFASNITIRIAHNIHEIDPSEWNTLSAGRPFQSHRWYQFGELVMQDCEPIYLLAYQGATLIGRASLWVIRSEPLPIGPGVGRVILQAILHRWPLLVCRSPLSNTTGLLLPSDSSRAETLQALAQAALSLSQQKKCSFLLFDFLGKEDCRGWSDGFSSVTVSDPGMVLRNQWQSIDEYLASGNKKDRQHYKRTIREAGKLGITIEKHTRVPDVSSALGLIQNVDHRYKNATNPWMRGLLENLEFIQGTWLEARQHDQLIGCGAIFEDNQAQLTTALGLTENIPYAYLLLTYASLEVAFTKNVRLLRWGSGAYEVKKQLGFETEDNAYIMVSGNTALTRLLIELFA